MPLPKPEINEEQNDFVARCTSFVMDEDKNIGQDQAVAMCFNEWKSEKIAEGKEGEIAETKDRLPAKKPLTKIEVLGKIKKLLEGTEFNISDDDLMNMFSGQTAPALEQEVDEFKKRSYDRQDFKLDIDFSKGNEHAIKVFPRKKVYIEKYKEIIDFNDKMFDDLIESFNCEALAKPYMDEGHKLGIKYADIKRLFKAEDGLYADIKLNDLGVDAIKNNKYSYISPEWGPRSDTNGLKHNRVLRAITLTNIPALEGENPTLQEQIKLQQTIGGNMDYSTKLEVLKASVGNYKLQEGEGVPLAQFDELMAIATDLVTKMQEAIAGKEVAEEVAEEMSEKFNALEGEKKKAEKEAYFKEKVSKGQLAAKDQEVWLEHYDNSPDFVKRYLDSRPIIEDTQLSLTSTEDSVKLSAEDSSIMKSLGLDPKKSEDLKFYLEQNKED